MKRMLLICGAAAAVGTTICGFVFGLAQPEAPVSMSWMQLSAMVHNGGADIEQITLELSSPSNPHPNPSSYPKIEVQFRKQKTKATISVEELRAKYRGTHCSILGAPPPAAGRIEWLIKESQISRIDVVEKIVGSNYRRDLRDNFYSEYLVKDGKRTEFPLLLELIVEDAK